MEVFKIIERDEGFRAFPYRDTEGKLTIGYGWNLEAVPMPRDLAETMARRMIAEIFRDLEVRFAPWWERIGEARQKALICMAYQMGIGGLLSFKKMLKALSRQHYERAYVEALQSKWAKQTPERAHRYAMVLKTGEERHFL